MKFILLPNGRLAWLSRGKVPYTNFGGKNEGIKIREKNDARVVESDDAILERPVDGYDSSVFVNLGGRRGI